MKEVPDLQALKKTIQNEHLLLLYLSMPHCSVCHAVKPRIERLLKNKLPLYHIDVTMIPEAAGYFQAWTAPVVLLFYQGKEIQRQARFIDFYLLEKTVDQYLNIPKPVSYQTLFDNLSSEPIKPQDEKKQGDESRSN